MVQTSSHIFEGSEIGLNSLTFGDGEGDSSLQVFLISKLPSNHTLGQDILFAATPQVRLLVNNHERARVDLIFLAFSQCEEEPLSWAPTVLL